MPDGPEPGMSETQPLPFVTDGSSYTGNTQSVYGLNSQYACASACCNAYHAPMLRKIFTRFAGVGDALPSVVKIWPGTLLPVPMPAIASASACVSVPNVA